MTKYGFFAGILISLLIGGGCDRKPQTPHLHLFAWSEYVPQEVIDGFKKETGIPVDYEVYSSNEEMLTKLSSSSGQYDLIQPSEYMVEHLIKRGMLAPLDKSQIPNAANLLQEFRDLSYDPGQKYSIPYMSGTVGIVVNADKIKEPVKSYRDAFNAKYKNRILVVDDNREIVSWAMSADGIGINDVTPQNLAKIKPLLAEWVDRIKAYNSDNPRGPFLNGDVDLGIVYSGDAAKLYEEDKKFQYTLPAEGAHQFIDNLCIPKDAKNKEAAMKFINYILRPQVSKMISDKFPYTNPNGEARKLLSESQLKNPASYPPDAGKLEVFHDIGPASKDISALMSELRK
jgi:spermidine/putrescine transport system permease protein